MSVLIKEMSREENRKDIMLWTMKKAGYRVVQAGLGMAMRVIPWGQPERVNYPGAIQALPAALRADGIKKMLLVTDRGVLRAGLVKTVCEVLEEAGVGVEVFSDVHPNPTIPDILGGLRRYKAQGCEGVLALGGGSSIDASKMIVALVALPDGSERKLGGLFQVTLRKRGKVPPLYAVPTTAGTGSETTIVAVVTEPRTHAKYTVMDFPLLPKRVFLDAQLTLTLPPRVTAQSGMDALTHAVEAYVNGYMATETTRRQAREATALIFRYLPRAFADGADLQAREKMLTAAFYAGQAFGRATVGYAHSIAHAVGGLTGLAHGELTGICLPALLEWYGEAAVPRLAELAEVIGVAEPGVTDTVKARAFIKAVYALRRSLGLAETLPLLSDEEVRTVCHRAVREANPLYPEPRMMSEQQCRCFVRLLMQQV